MKIIKLAYQHRTKSVKICFLDANLTPLADLEPLMEINFINNRGQGTVLFVQETQLPVQFTFI